MRVATLTLCLSCLALGCGEAAAVREAETVPETADPPARVVVFTRTEGFRHDSIADGVEALRQLARRRGLVAEATEDPAAFTAEALADVAAVVFLNTSGDVLDAPAEAALRAYVEGGGGWLGVHAASDTEYDWPWYGALVGAYFDSHPEVQQAALDVSTAGAAAGHPAVQGLPARWVRTDEWYNFRAPPSGVAVLLRLDASSYRGGTMGPDHPVAWTQTVGRGRAVYTALGHTAESYAEPLFRSHLDGALCWAAGLDC